MALIDKNNKIIANKSQVIKVFETEEAFLAWKNSLPDPEVDILNFNIIKKYSYAASDNIVACIINGETFGINKLF